MRLESYSAAETEAKKSEYDLLFSKAKYGTEPGYPYVPSTVCMKTKHRNNIEISLRSAGSMAV